MVLPVLHSFPDTVDWSKTVDPYIHRLIELPFNYIGVLLGRRPFLDLYLKTNPFITGLYLSILFGAIFLIVAEINKNYSQVDRCWSLLPTFYIAHFDLWARLSGLPSQRLDLILAFSALWSARLTFNYWRKGGYQVGSEDYRWEIVRDTIPNWAFKILNVTFISFMQSILLFSLAAPVYPILLSLQFQPNVTLVDLLFLSFELALLATEYISDEQQWEYQNAKKAYKDTGKVSPGYTANDFERGFNTHGLWAWSRHPNFACEQSIWITLGYWAAANSEEPFSWTLLPGAALVSLFQGSTWLTERITAGKYPEYREYQRQIGMFVPNIFNLGPYKPPPPGTVQGKVTSPKESVEEAIEPVVTGAQKAADKVTAAKDTVSKEVTNAVTEAKEQVANNDAAQEVAAKVTSAKDTAVKGVANAVTEAKEKAANTDLAQEATAKVTAAKDTVTKEVTNAVSEAKEKVANNDAAQEVVAKAAAVKDEVAKEVTDTVTAAKEKVVKEPKEQQIGTKSAPAKESEAKETATKEAPKTPTKKSPSKGSSTKETPTKKTPTKDTPTKETSKKDTPTKETPTKETPSKETPSKESSNKASRPKETGEKASQPKEAGEKVSHSKEAGDSESGANESARKKKKKKPQPDE